MTGQVCVSDIEQRDACEAHLPLLLHHEHAPGLPDESVRVVCTHRGQSEAKVLVVSKQGSATTSGGGGGGGEGGRSGPGAGAGPG